VDFVVRRHRCHYSLPASILDPPANSCSAYLDPGVFHPILFASDLMRLSLLAITAPLLSLFVSLHGLAATEFDTERLAAIRGKMQKFVDDAGPSQVAGAVIVVGSSQGV